MRRKGKPKRRVTHYEARRDATAKVAARCARRHGSSTWSFRYRGQDVTVTAKKTRGKIRFSTSHVRNKG